MRDVTVQDSPDLLAWRNEIDVRKFSRNQREISELVHRNWLVNRLDRLPGEPFWAFENGAEKIGFIRFEFNPILNHHEISISVNPSLRGRGYGRVILNHAIEKFWEAGSAQSLYAEIHRENEVSKSLFVASGFMEFGSDKHFLFFKRDASFN